MTTVTLEFFEIWRLKKNKNSLDNTEPYTVIQMKLPSVFPKGGVPLDNPTKLPIPTSGKVRIKFSDGKTIVSQRYRIKKAYMTKDIEKIRIGDGMALYKIPCSDQIEYNTDQFEKLPPIGKFPVNNQLGQPILDIKLEKMDQPCPIHCDNKKRMYVYVPTKILKIHPELNNS